MRRTPSLAFPGMTRLCRGGSLCPPWSLRDQRGRTRRSAPTKAKGKPAALEPEAEESADAGFLGTVAEVAEVAPGPHGGGLDADGAPSPGVAGLDTWVSPYP